MLAGGMNLERFCNPGRFAEIARLHRRAFAWEPQGRTPRGNHAVNSWRIHRPDCAAWLEAKPFYGEAFAYVVRRCGSFRERTEEFVPRFRGELGLPLYTQVGSVEGRREARAVWQEARRP